MHSKEFDNWNHIKKTLNETTPPLFKEREVWWCSVGVNIGDEMDGKGRLYNRPVVIIRKFNKQIFYGIPFSTAIKDNPYYFPITLNGRNQSALISQMRILEAKRLTQKIARLPKEQFDSLREALKNLL